MANQLSMRVILNMMLVLGGFNALNIVPRFCSAQDKSTQNPQEAFLTSTNLPPNTNRIELFTTSFVKTVKCSQQLLRVFDVSIPSLQISKEMFQTYQDALIRAGANKPASLAKTLADAVYLTLPFISEDTYAFVISRSMATYMISQNVLTVENSALYAQQFCEFIQKNILITSVSNIALVGALSNGIVDFLKAHGPSVIKHSAAFTISTARHFYALTVISKPQMAFSVVDPTDSIPDATEEYGVRPFALTFLKAVHSSSVLQGFFYSNESGTVTRQAWQSSMKLFCISIKCNAISAYNAETDLSEYLSKSTYIKAIGNAYALSLIGIGALQSDNIDLQANRVAKSIENFLTELPPTADLATRLGAIFSAFQSIMTPEINIVNQYPAFANYIETGLYAVSPVSARIPEFNIQN